MKNINILESFLRITGAVSGLILAALCTSACNFSPKAILGGRVEVSTATVESGANPDCYNLASVMAIEGNDLASNPTVAPSSTPSSLPSGSPEEAPSGTACSDPTDSVADVETRIQGTIRVWVKKLADGQFPIIASLGYYSPQVESYDVLHYQGPVFDFSCTTSSTTATGNRGGLTQAIDCIPKLPGVRSSYKVAKLYYLKLSNLSCSRTVSYIRSTKTYACSDMPAATDSIGQVHFPHLWF
jgi:hypothetical protein